MENKYINYFPDYLKSYKELIGLSIPINIILNDLIDNLTTIINNQFIETLDIKGIEIWEIMANLIYDPSIDTLEMRRDNISAMLLSQTTLNEHWLQNIINELVGNTLTIVTVEPNNYYIVIDLPGNSRISFDIIYKKIRNLIPANLILTTNIHFEDQNSDLYLGVVDRMIKIYKYRQTDDIYNQNANLYFSGSEKQYRKYYYEEV